MVQWTKGWRGVVLMVAFLLAMAGIVYLDFTAYRQRFPQAESWTYLFRGRN